MGQTLAIIAIVAAAALFIGWRVWRAMGARAEHTACGTCPVVKRSLK